MDSGAKKAFQVKVRSLTRTLKEYKAYLNEVGSYDMNVVSQDKKKQQFYDESKSALDQVEKKLIEFYQQLSSYIEQNKASIEGDETVQADYESAKTIINEVKMLLPAAV